MEKRVKILVAELEVQQKEIFKLHFTIQEKSKRLKSHLDDEDLINSLAYKLHNLYSAYEDLFKLVARFFENQIADISGYHTEFEGSSKAVAEAMLCGKAIVASNIL